ARRRSRRPRTCRDVARHRQRDRDRPPRSRRRRRRTRGGRAPRASGLVLRRAAWPAHRNAILLDDVGGAGMPVLVALHAAARIALAVERVRVALLLVRAVLLASPAPASEHGWFVPLPP